MTNQPDTELYFVQDSRGNVGNNLMFWGPEHSGYTSDLRKAGQYSREEAFALHNSRSSDIPWPVSYVMARRCEEADMQYLKLEAAAAHSLAQGYYVQPLPARFEGNSMLFVAAKGGHTARRSEALVHSMTDKPVIGQAWPCAVVDPVWRPVANAQDMNLREALGADFELLAKPERKRGRERYRCVGCGVFMAESAYWGSPCRRCKTDNRP